MKKNRNRLLLLLLVLMLSLCMTSCLSGHGGTAGEGGGLTTGEAQDDAPGEDNPEPRNIYFDEEEDGAEVTMAPASQDKFFGTWEATSDYAVYAYGNVEITVEPGGKWTGNITDEPLTGTWKETSEGLACTCEWIDFTLFFTDKGTLIMCEKALEDYEEDYLTVLTPKK